MMNPTDSELVGHELSIDQLDAVVGGGLFGWIEHKVSDALHWIGRHTREIGAAFYAIAGKPIYNAVTHKQN